eukprot:10603785-Alexandrium_andersonii.AAC.1
MFVHGNTSLHHNRDTTAGTSHTSNMNVIVVLLRRLAWSSCRCVGVSLRRPACRRVVVSTCVVVVV